MSNIQLLDCTLRDGGYINDWKFGKENIKNIFTQLVKSKVDIIEIGFLDERRMVDYNRTIMPVVSSLEENIKNIDKDNSMVVGMIDYGTFDIAKLVHSSESYLGGIRVIFKKNVMKEAIEYCKKVKALGYKVFVQLVSITSYNEAELLETIEYVNDFKPYAISIVDTYGVMYPKDLLYYYNILEENVDDNIKIGFHGHNNIQLAYANSLTFIEKKRKHDIIVDGTLYGMGKGAGNAPLELLAKILNVNYNKSYNIEYIIDVIEMIIMEYSEKYSWGYNINTYISGVNKCHPKYIEFYKGKEYPMSRIDNLVSCMDEDEKRLLYDRLTAEKNYHKDLIKNIHRDKYKDNLCVCNN